MKNHNEPLEGGIAALCCAFGLFAATAIAYFHSGAALNPMIGIVQTVLGDYFSRKIHLTGGTIEYGYGSLWLYILGPIIGGILGGFFYKVTYEVQAKINYDAKHVKAEN